MILKYPDPYYIIKMTTNEFILGMLNLGKFLDLNLVGVFDEKGRGSRRDIELPMHQDGIFYKDLADVQDGYYVENPDIDIVGLYCIQEPKVECITTIQLPDQSTIDIHLHENDALIFDNRQVLHGRKGPVGDRLLLRIWIKKK